MLTPFEQAKEYDDKSGFDDKARWIITCNFKEFWIYDMTKTGKELYAPVAKLKLEDLPKHLDWLAMIGKGTDLPKQTFTEEVEVSTKAGELVGILYDDLYKNYKNPDDETLRQLNILCVRIVFCLYAEDAGLFDKDNRKMFHDYLAQFDAQHMRRALASLFKVLSQDPDKGERDKYLEDDDPLLASFPYVNGGLFEGDVEIPPFTDETVDILLNKESMGFDWSKISPTIFGAVFESTLNQDTRRKGGMHYTSLENIHKVIDPLFLNDLNKELDEILALKTHNVRNRRLREFQDKLSQIRCFDPACGSGNFLTESYLSLRRLENKALKARLGQNIAFGFEEADLTPIKVSIQQFYGIEINDFAVSVAKTALWIAEAQMFEETQTILNSDKDFLPLETFTNIHEGDALKIDWNTIRRTEHLYIMGNPPFVAKTGRTSSANASSAAILSAEQKKEKENLFGKDAGVLDYVACWFKKAILFIKNTNNEAAFVATDSICQGQQVAPLWNSLLSDGIKIKFAYRFFKWESEATSTATVYVVIIGFSSKETPVKFIYNNKERKQAKHINPYIIDAPDILVTSRNTPLCDVPSIGMGNQPIDNGYYLFKYDDMVEFIRKEPKSEHYFHPWLDANGFINNRKKYCLWLGDCSIAELKEMPECLKLVQQVRDFRLKSKRKSTIKLADRPTHFQTENMPKGNYIAIPEVSSGSRKYIPMGFLNEDVLCSNKLRLMPDATLFQFGILESSTHMSWMRTIGGYFGPSYQYSINIVYNNFPWPTANDSQKQLIIKTANEILEVRKYYPQCSLSDIYNPDDSWMYPELVKAHEANDRAVMAAYGFDKSMTEPEIVAELMKMYQNLVNHQ